MVLIGRLRSFLTTVFTPKISEIMTVLKKKNEKKNYKMIFCRTCTYFLYILLLATVGFLEENVLS